MRVFIAEKPSVANVIGQALGVKERKEGYMLTKNGDCVTWCFGHLLELAEPDYYLGDNVPNKKNGNGKVWRIDDLPIIPQKWVKIPKKDCKKQLKIIGDLLKKSDSVVNCGDPDREGQLLVDEVLDYFKYNKPSFRYWASAQDASSVKQALASLKPNKDFQGMALAAQGRSRADWLIGMNLSRAYSLAAKRCNVDLFLAVGRVQTPTLNLVAQRDLEIQNFKPQTYFTVTADLMLNGQNIKSTLDLSHNVSPLDGDGRLNDLTRANEIAQEIQNCKDVQVTKVEQKIVEQEQPKSLSLADVQMYASSKFGFSAQKTLDICQSLYETHKLTTYPRTDCSNLPEIQHKDAPKVLDALSKVNPDLKPLISKADPSIKSKTWDDKKVTAHHGIIPTQQIGDRSKLSEDESKIYLFIVKRYLAQFYPKCKTSQTKITFTAENYSLVSNGATTIQLGFKQLFKDDEAEQDNENSVIEQALPVCTQGDRAQCMAANVKNNKTQPPSRFNEGTLIRAMENIASVVQDPTYKKFLKDGDGIGTSATRAGIIEELKKKGYLETKGKQLKCSEKGFRLLKNLPDMLKNPVLTAIFESNLTKIERGELKLEHFLKEQVLSFVLKQVEKSKTTTIL